MGVLELLRTGYGCFFDSNGRVTLVGLAWFVALYGALCAFGAAAWRAALGTEPPALVAALFSAGALGFWLSPLVSWIVETVRRYGVLRWGRLKAGRGVIATWGGGLGLLLPLTHGGADLLAQRAMIGAVSAGCAYAALRLLDRVAIMHAALGVAGAAAAGWAGSRALGMVAGSVHRAHLVGQLTAVHADRLPAWIAVGAVATGGLITTALHLWGGQRGRRHQVAPAVHAVAPDAPPQTYGEEAAEFLHRAGAGAENLACEYDREAREYDRKAENARRGRDAERAVAAVLVVLAARGWSLEAGLYIIGEPIGDIDLFLTGPSGRRYAIDVKAQDCTVGYDPVCGELVLRYARGEERPPLLATARRQVDALERHGYGPVQPVLCFHCADIRCATVVDGVVVIASGALLQWLETTDPQAWSMAFTVNQHG